MITLAVDINGFPKEEYTYGLGQIIRNQNDVFYCLQAFQSYINELQRVHDFYTDHELSIKHKDEQTKEGC